MTQNSIDSSLETAFATALPHIRRMRAHAPDSSSKTAFFTVPEPDIGTLRDALEVANEDVRQVLRLWNQRSGPARGDRQASRWEERDATFAKLSVLRQLDTNGTLPDQQTSMGMLNALSDSGPAVREMLAAYEALLALNEASVLTRLRSAGGRPWVWVIGGGLGIFAAALMSAVPEVVIAITDLPELLLLSATTVLAEFPDARPVFAATVEEARINTSKNLPDLIFIPQYLATGWKSSPLELTVAARSFDRAPIGAVTSLVRRSWILQSRWLYVMSAITSKRPPKLQSVLARYFWLRDVPLLAVREANSKKGKDKPPLSAEAIGIGFHHTIGTRREILS